MDHLEVELRNGRWWAKSVPGFDGTAQGYGYRTREALMKCYWYCADEVRQKRRKTNDKLRLFLNANPDVEAMLQDYFHEDTLFYRLKEGRKTTYSDFLESVPRSPEGDSIAERLRPYSRQFKALERKVLSRTGSHS